MDERTYIINLRRKFNKVPNYKRSSKSIRSIRDFISRHMKTKEVIIGQYLNQKIWEHGRKNPPPKVEVKAIKQENKVLVELASAPIKTEEPEEKKKTKKENTETEKSKEEPQKAQEPKESKKESPKEVKEKTTKKVEKIPTASELKAKKESKK